MAEHHWITGDRAYPTAVGVVYHPGSRCVRIELDGAPILDARGVAELRRVLGAILERLNAAESDPLADPLRADLGDDEDKWRSRHLTAKIGRNLTPPDERDYWEARQGFLLTAEVPGGVARHAADELVRRKWLGTYHR